MSRPYQLAATLIVALLLGLGISAAIGADGGFRVKPGSGSSIQGDLGLVRSLRPGVRVLFIGDSLTAANDMIHSVARLAASAGARPIFPVEYAPGGSTLADAARDPRLVDLLKNNRWADVVLQENSNVPEQAPAWTAGARALQRLIMRTGARTIVFETWGFRDGYPPKGPSDTYGDMQQLLFSAYDVLRYDLPAIVAPVGHAWRAALNTQASPSLWMSDGVHPSEVGSYLAACVLYGTLDAVSPLSSRYTAELNPKLAQQMRRIADAQLLGQTSDVLGAPQSDQ